MLDCTPFSAPTAAHCDGVAGPEVWCDWMLPIASASSVLAIAQPMRNPVMAYIFETPWTTTSFELVRLIRRELVAVRGGLAVEDQPVVEVVHDQVEALLLAELDDLPR